MPPVRISVKASYGGDYIAANADGAGWGRLRGRPPALMPDIDMQTWNPPNFTTETMEGTCNIAMHLLSEQPGNRMPYPELQVLAAQAQDRVAPCSQDNCEGLMSWVDIDGNPIDLSYSSATGFLDNGEPVEWRVVGDRWEGAAARCRVCGWMVPPAALSSIRPRLSAADDLGLTTLSENEPKPRWRKQGRRLRPGTDSRSGFVELTARGELFVSSMGAGDAAEAVEILSNQLRGLTQKSASYPQPEQQTEAARKNTLESGLTEGYPVRDFSVFVDDNGTVTKDEERVFSMFYGRDFNRGCEDCKMGDITGCPLKGALTDLGCEPSEAGCRANLGKLVGCYRNGIVEWEQYALASRGRERNGYQRLVISGTGEEVWSAEWTWQLDKEGLNQVRAFAAHAGDVEVEYRSTRHFATTAGDPIHLADFEPMGTPALIEPQFSGEAWMPSAFQKLMLGIEEEP